MFDVIKKSVLDQFAQGISIADMLWSLGVAFLMGLFILLVYKQTFRGVLFSKGYAFSLVLLAMVTALVIRTISSNLALSLGMVGALSIVRFRTAIKDPMDLLFLFWSIGTGIICGASLYGVAAICAIAVTVALLLLSVVPMARAPFLLVVSGGDASLEEPIIAAIKSTPALIRSNPATFPATTWTWSSSCGGRTAPP